MHRTISNYKITKRKDGRYYVRIQDRGDVAHIYGKRSQKFGRCWIDGMQSRFSLSVTSRWQIRRIYI